MIKYILFLIIIFFLFACNVQKNKKEEVDQALIVKELATEKYGNHFKVVANKTEEYTLVINKTKQFSDIGFDIDFFIYDHSTQEIIIEDFLDSGHVDWIDAQTIKAVDRKRIEEYKRQKLIYTFDVVTKQKELKDSN